LERGVGGLFVFVSLVCGLGAVSNADEDE